MTETRHIDFVKHGVSSRPTSTCPWIREGGSYSGRFLLDAFDQFVRLKSHDSRSEPKGFCSSLVHNLCCMMLGFFWEGALFRKFGRPGRRDGFPRELCRL